MVGPRGRDAGAGTTQVERFDTGGRVTGWIGLVASVGMLGVWFASLSEPLPVWVLTGSIFAGLLFWAAILRPTVTATGETLLLRNMLEDVRIPLAAVEEHAVRQVLAVRAGEKRYVGTGVGRSLKASTIGTRAERVAERSGGTAQVIHPADFVEARIADLAAQARERARVQRYSEEQVALAAGVRRSRTWLVIAPLVASFTAMVLSVVLA